MAKIHLYGQDYEVYEKEMQVQISKDSLIVSQAKPVLLQTPDRKQAHLAFLAAGGELFLANIVLTRASADFEELEQAYDVLMNQTKSSK